MRRRERTWRRGVAGAAIALLAVAASGCRTCGDSWFLLPQARALNALKNRTAIPVDADVDRRATLEALLAPGDDRQRWSVQRAARVEGYVVRILDADPEVVNCLSRVRVDAHIELALRPDAPPAERLIAEVTPPMRDWAAARGMDWSTAVLQRTLTGRRVHIEGWLLFDESHDDEAANTNPRGRGNWRATAWEVHPITSMAIVPPE